MDIVYASMHAGESGDSGGVPSTIESRKLDTNSSGHERARSERVSRRHVQTTKSLRGGLGAFQRRKRWFNNSRNICLQALGASQIITSSLPLLLSFKSHILNHRTVGECYYFISD